MDDTTPTPSPPGKTVPVHDVRALVGTDGRAALMLDGMLYMLRITHTGKLILTK